MDLLKTPKQTSSKCGSPVSIQLSAQAILTTGSLISPWLGWFNRSTPIQIWTSIWSICSRFVRPERTRWESHGAALPGVNRIKEYSNFRRTPGKYSTGALSTNEYFHKSVVERMKNEGTGYVPPDISALAEDEFGDTERMLSWLWLEI